MNLSELLVLYLISILIFIKCEATASASQELYETGVNYNFMLIFVLFQFKFYKSQLVTIQHKLFNVWTHLNVFQFNMFATVIQMIAMEILVKELSILI